MRNYAPEPRAYELMTILSPDVPDEEIPTQLDSIAGYVTNAGGSVAEVLRESPWGRRRLAYPIRHEGRDLRDGFYTVFHFSIVPGQVAEVERELKLNTQLIRYLITHYEPQVSPHTPRVEGEQPAEAEAPEAAATAAPAVEAPAAEAPAATEPSEAPSDVSPAEETAVEAETVAENLGAAEAREETGAEVPETVEASQETIDAVEETDAAVAEAAEAAEETESAPAEAEAASEAETETSAAAESPKGETEEA